MSRRRPSTLFLWLLFILPSPAIAKNELKDCAKGRLLGRTYEVLVSTLPALPEGGELGKGREPPTIIAGVPIYKPDTAYADLKGDGTVKGRGTRSLGAFTQGELVRIVQMNTGLGSFSAELVSVVPHGLQRGRGAFEHQVMENYRLTLNLPGKDIDCEPLLALWGKLMSEVADVAAWEAENGKTVSGATVAELREGMTPAEVEGVLGTPQRTATLGGKTLYFYPQMKVTFTDGKVSGIE